MAAWVSPIYDIDKERMLVAWASPGEPYEAPQIVTDRRFPTFPQVTVTDDGKALVSFSAAATATAEVQEIRPAAVSLVRPGQPPTAPRGLTSAPGGADESPPQVRHAGGRTIAGWRVGGAMHVAALSPDGEPSAERTIHMPQFVAIGPAVAVGSTGRAMASWIDLGTGALAGVTGVSPAQLNDPYQIASVEQEGVWIYHRRRQRGLRLAPHHPPRDAHGLRCVRVARGCNPGRPGRRLRAGRPRQRLRRRSPADDGQRRLGHPGLGRQPTSHRRALERRHGVVRGGARNRAGPGARRPQRVARAAGDHRRPGDQEAGGRARVRCAQASACRGPAALGAGRLTLATGRLELAARSTGTLVLRPRTAKARARLRRRGTLNALLGVRLAQAGAPSAGVALPVKLRIRR